MRALRLKERCHLNLVYASAVRDGNSMWVWVSWLSEAGHSREAAANDNEDNDNEDNDNEANVNRADSLRDAIGVHVFAALACCSSATLPLQRYTHSRLVCLNQHVVKSQYDVCSCSERRGRSESQHSLKGTCGTCNYLGW